MATGKSTVGRLLAEQCGRPYVDLDAEIEHATGRPVATLFAERGEPAFRAIESIEPPPPVELAEAGPAE